MAKKGKLDAMSGIKPRKVDCISVNTQAISSSAVPRGDLKYSYDHMAKPLTEYAKRKIGENWGCYYVLWPTGYAEYLLWQLANGNVIPMYSSQSSEDISVKIDVFHLATTLEEKLYAN